MIPVAHRCLAWGTLILWMGVIFLLSAQPGLAAHGDMTWRFLLERKGAHVFEYVVLTLLTFRAVRVSFPTLSRREMWIIGCFAVSYALSDEFHQTFVRGREGKFSDVVIDSIGILIALGVVFGLKRMRGKEQV